MRMIDIIETKKRKETLSKEQIDFAVNGYTGGEIPDYQMSALLMAVYLNGMNPRETRDLTLSMAASGDQMDLSGIKGVKVDKHSTGGVGDKTSMVIGPIVAACGVPVAKMSGRGLGHTGGTIDKLESIPGFETMLAPEQFISQTNKIGMCLVGQTGNLTPADKKIYALRDVTATVDNLSLIASSIMSKKIAAGADAILLDVKTGSGAFMKTKEEAAALAKEMITIGKNAGRKTAALITNMDVPLGNAIGNALEVIEATQTLRGEGPHDLETLCLELAAAMLELAGKGTETDCRAMAQEALTSGRALEKWKEVVKAQGGDSAYIEDLSLFPKAEIIRPYRAARSGYLDRFDTEACGIAACMLGAGRETKEDTIDFRAGIVLLKKLGDYVEEGEPIAMFHTSSEQQFLEASRKMETAVTISGQVPQPKPLIYAKLTEAGL
ncbi:pyrimidine-nucleoside phosphorylase [Massiliimalia massiliensis]|uniref:pyrimidine-nucleoside phosphorylase n=1 Tax=Massiliimalia massiliensis TaxID=1852384 RepID=UPI0009844821|nr:pyrimidine-nucleoside phosphorylase [Massiliimalia massiliensis]